MWVLKDPHSTGTRIWPSAGDIASKVAKILLRLWAVVTLDPLRSGLWKLAFGFWYVKNAAVDPV